MKISFNKLNLKALSTFVQRVITLSKQERFNEIVGNHPVLKTVEAEFAAYQKSFGKARTSGKGSQLAEQDKLRDQLFRQFKKQIDSLAKMNGLANQAMAKDLLTVIAPYIQNLSKQNYAEGSAQINKCLQELEGKANQDKIKQLHLSESFTLLKTAQQQFETLYLAVNKENVALKNLPSASTLKKPLIQAVNDYLQLVASMRSQTKWDRLNDELSRLLKTVDNPHHKAENSENTEKEAEANTNPPPA